MEGPLPIHIRGMAGRFPGADHDPEKLWSLLLQNGDLTCEIPESRFDKDAWPDLPRKAALLDGVECVDLAAFGLKRDEAADADPQRFLLLEATMRGMEDAGLAMPLRPPENRVAVFVGCMNGDWQELVHASEISPLFAQGAARSMLAAQVAFAFDFTGALSVLDTACSSSLAALHQGIRTLRDPAEETRVATCFGVNLCLSMTPWMSLQKAGMISDRCRTFCKDAEGYGRGEGCGNLVLGAGAQAACDWAEVLNSCLRSSGYETTSITKPSVVAQRSCMELAWGEQTRGLCQYLESHGTGTKTGDPLECSSMSKVFGSQTACVRPGGVKANVNHLEGAAGMAGVQKTLLCMAKELQLPFGGGCWNRGNSSFNFGANGLLEPLEYACNWAAQPGDGRRYAGVNSFGFGGQNAHVALVSPRAGLAEPGDEGRSSKRPRWNTRLQDGQLPPPMLQLSAPTPQALESWKALLIQRLQRLPATDSELRSWAHQSTARLSHPLSDSGLRWGHPHRFACPVETPEALLKHLQRGSEEAAVPTPASRATGCTEILFVCCGNGNLKPGVMQELCSLEPCWRKLQTMDRALPTDFPVRKTLQELDAMLPADFPIHLWEWCCGTSEVPKELEASQVLLFACQVSQARLWEVLGVSPGRVVAHSAGEMSAAVIAGSLSLGEGLEVTRLRGRAQQRAQLKQQREGAMVAAGCSAETFQGLPVHGCELACVNTKRDITLAIPDGARAEDVEKVLLREGGASYAKKLPVSTAFHSSVVDGELEDLRCRLLEVLLTDGAQELPQESSRPVQHFSSITGGRISPEEARDAQLWVKGVRRPVLFEAALTSCFQFQPEATDGGSAGHDGICAVELGPGHLLGRYVQQVAQDSGAQLSLRLNSSTLGSASKHRAQAPHAALVTTLAGLWQEGLPVRLPWQPGPEALLARASLPLRPFHRESVWAWPALNQRLRAEGHGVGAIPAKPPHVSGEHPYLLGDRPSPSALTPGLGAEGSTTDVESLHVSPERTPLVYHHLWRGQPLVPGALQAEAALSAFLRAEALAATGEAKGAEGPAESLRAGGAAGVRGLSLEIHFLAKCQALEAATGTALLLEVHTARPGGRFVLKDSSDGKVYAKGKVHRCPCGPALRLDLLELRSGTERSPGEVYRVLEKRAELHFGGLLKGMRKWWWDAERQLGLTELQLPRELWAELQGCVVPPGLLDMCLQQIAFWLLQDETEASAIPKAIRALQLLDPDVLGPRMLAYFQVLEAAEDQLVFSAGLLALDGTVALEVREAVAHLWGPRRESRSDKHLPRPLEDCLFKLAPSPLKAPPAPLRSEGSFVLLGDKTTPLVQGLLKQLGESRCQLYEHLPDAEATDAEAGGPVAVVFCHTGQVHRDPADPSFYNTLRSNLESLCRLVLDLHKRQAKVPLWVVTCKTPLVQEEHRSASASPSQAEYEPERRAGLSPAGGAFWGLVKNLVNENLLPEGGETEKWSQLRILELDDPHSQESLAALAQELASGLRPDAAEVLILGGQPHRLEVVREDWLPTELRPQGTLIRGDAAYLITGALGQEGLGFLNAEWLSQRGAGRVILCGRRRPPAELPALACQVELWPGLDICDGEALKQKVEAAVAGERGMPLAGVFHAAAAFKMPDSSETDGLLLRKEDLRHLDVVLRPKVQGTVALAAALDSLPQPVDFLVLHSSVVSLAGNLGQAAYGAANGFQDSFALFRQAQGHATTLAVNWSSLEDVGTLHNKQAMTQYLQDTRGFVPLKRGAVERSLEVVLALRRPQLAVSPFDWQKVQSSALIDNPLLRNRFASLTHELALEETRAAAGATEAAEAILSGDERRERLRQILSANMRPGTVLRETSTLEELGFDSTDLYSVQHAIKQRLNRQVQVGGLMSLSLGQLLCKIE